MSPGISQAYVTDAGRVPLECELKSSIFALACVLWPNEQGGVLFQRRDCVSQILGSVYEFRITRQVIFLEAYALVKNLTRVRDALLSLVELL